MLSAARQHKAELADARQSHANAVRVRRAVIVHKAQYLSPGERAAPAGPATSGSTPTTKGTEYLRHTMLKVKRSNT